MHKMNKNWSLAFVVLALALCAFMSPEAGGGSDDITGEIKLSKGFEAAVVLDSLGRNRHIAVAPNGDLFVKLERPLQGSGIYHLRRKANGKYEKAAAFGNYGGTGILVHASYLYASSDDAVYRYELDANFHVKHPSSPQTIVQGLWSRKQHASKSLAIDGAGNLYVNIGAPSNACQQTDRTKGSPGMDPCPILDSAGGIWQFRADVLNQGYAQGKRYATGLRNVVGLDWNTQTNSLFVMQHGRDQLSNLYPELYNDEQNAELPAEEFFEVKPGDDFGWPYCYFDPAQNKKVLAPEFGGDGKNQERCAGKGQPILAFPAHWGPNAVLFYTGNQFPEKYKNGAFIAFHGSWNRAPLRQAGYLVAFVPFNQGKVSGPYEIFADGFTQKEFIMSTGDARWRPCGLAQTPEGSLLISDSRKGRVWEIRFKG